MGVVEVADGWFLVPIYYFIFAWEKVSKKRSKRDNNVLFSLDACRFPYNGMCNIRFCAICGNLKIILCRSGPIHLFRSK